MDSLRGARLALERPAEPFEAFQGFGGKQTAGLKPLKADGPSVWPGMFSGRVALDGPAGGEIGFGKACGSI